MGAFHLCKEGFGFLDGEVAFVVGNLLLVFVRDFGPGLVYERFCRALDGLLVGECFELVGEEELLYELERENVALVAILFFLFLVAFLSDNHIGVNLTCGHEALGLDDFEILGDFCPFVGKELVGFVAVYERNRGKKVEDVTSDGIFL